jgi:hypothetical protein
MTALYREVEAATLDLEREGLGLAFPVPGMMMKHWEPKPLPQYLVRSRRRYERALALARSAGAAGRGCRAARYWAGRLEFGVRYIDTIEHVRRAATFEQAGRRGASLTYARRALESARGSIEALVRVAQDRSDLGGIAVMNEYVYRPLRAKVAALETDATHATPGARAASGR